MDLGCLDLGCIEKQISQSSHDSEKSPNGSLPSNSKSGKNKTLKQGDQSNMGVLNKLTTQIKKPSHRKTSPLNWFPRKKVDSYLKRKIKLLQEVGGMNSTLDETLGDSNPHYSKVLREKIAVREAAHKAMEARKAALVEASWCRILRAAMIESKEAEALLLKAEKGASEAFEAASAIGVIMFDIPDCPGKHYEIETSAVNAGASTTHTVRASFETAFDVDKQVAAAVKAAFVKLASCSSVNKDEFKELLKKISQNPDTDENSPQLSKFSSECESDAGSDLETGSYKDNLITTEMDLTKSKQIKCRKSSEKFSTPKLVDMMLQRLRCLHEEELASLATIVATCGLNAALAEAETSTSLTSSVHVPRTMSSFGEGRKGSVVNMDGQTRRKQAEAEVPSLDKFLVKHLTRLEREVQDAKKARKDELELGNHDNENVASVKSIDLPETTTTGLGSILVKRYSKFEKEIEEAKKNSGEMFEKDQKTRNNDVVSLSETSTDLGSVLTTKHTSKLVKEIEETKRRKCGELYESKAKKEIETVPDFGSALTTKHTSKLEKEIEEAKRKCGKLYESKDQKSDSVHHWETKEEVRVIPSLDKFLVKHVSKLEREVQEAKKNSGEMFEKDQKIRNSDVVSLSETSTDLGSVLTTKHTSKLEKEIEETKRMCGELYESKAKKEIETVPDLGSALTTKHTSKLEKEIEEAKRKCGRLYKLYESKAKKEIETVPDLGSALTTKHTSKLEKEIEEAKRKCGKLYESKDQKSDSVHHWETKEVRVIPSLDKFLVKHVSKLEREVQEAKNRRNIELPGRRELISSTTEPQNSALGEEKDQNGKENINMNKQSDREFEMKEKEIKPTLPLQKSTDSEESISEATEALSLQEKKNESKETESRLDKILVKPIHGLEGEKMKSLSSRRDDSILQRKSKCVGGSATANCESLDKVLVKHVSKLEKEKIAVGTKEEVVKIRRRDRNSQLVHSEGSLDQILVKHKSSLEREKVAAAEQPLEGTNYHVVARKEARERNLQLEQSEGSLDQILVKHKSRLEREKVAAAAEQTNNQMKQHFVARKEARERELQEAWGGLSFGNSMQPRMSRLQRDKAAWLKAEEEERRRAMEGEV